MAQKKIDDVKRPEKVTPSASARPIIVTNHPLLASDPMVVGEGTNESEKSEETKLTVRTGKTIQPVSEDLKAPEEESDPAPKLDEDEKSAEPEAKPEKEAETKPGEGSEEEKPAPQPEAETEAPEEAENPPSKEETKGESADRDVDAAASAAEAEAEAARQEREAELESLIASGKYAAPINAVSRKRSRMHIILFCLLGVVLAVALVDVLLDMGTLRAPESIPRTHFFTVK